jgi:hypothetical protein
MGWPLSRIFSRTWWPMRPVGVVTTIMTENLLVVSVG